MARIRITDDADVERATLTIDKYQIREEGFNVLPEAEVWVTRDLYNDVDGVVPGEDRAYIEVDGTDAFGGILRSPEGQGGRTKIAVRGFAQYMDRAPSVPTGQHKVAAADSTLIHECIDATPELTAGTIETIETGQTWVFGGITQWEKAVKVANEAGGELEVTTDRVVNYVAQRGSDKTATTLSPANQSFVEDTFVVSEDGVSGNTTHLLVTGVGQGTAQVEVAIVPAADSTDWSRYDRVETYTNANWDDGDPMIWGRPRGNKDLKNGDIAASWGTRLMEELQSTELRVSTVVKSDAVALGDRFHVDHPEEGVDQNLRAVELVEMLTPNAGRRWEVVFSNYAIAHREESVENSRNAQRYGTSAYEGDLVDKGRAPGRGPVGVGHDYVMKVRYPDDVVAEVDAELLISGLNFRAYSAGGASGGDHTHSVDVTHPSHDHSVDVTHPSHDHTIDTTTPAGGAYVDHVNPLSYSWSTSGGATYTDTFDLPGVPGNAAYCYVFFTVQYRVDDNASGDVGAGDVRIRNLTKGADIEPYSGIDSTYERGDQRLYQASQRGDVENDTIEVAFDVPSGYGGTYLFNYGGIVSGKHSHDVSDTSTAALGTTTTETSSAELGTTTSETSGASGPHTHDPEPGILDWDGTERSPAYYPENVDVVVNGTSLGYALGDGTAPFEEVVPMGGELAPGWNVIRLTSDQLGHLDAAYSADLFRQSL